MILIPRFDRKSYRENIAFPKLIFTSSHKLPFSTILLQFQTCCNGTLLMYTQLSLPFNVEWNNIFLLTCYDWCWKDIQGKYSSKCGVNCSCCTLTTHSLSLTAYYGDTLLDWVWFSGTSLISPDNLCLQGLICHRTEYKIWGAAYLEVFNNYAELFILVTNVHTTIC